MIVHAIDPGPERSGWVLFGSPGDVFDAGVADNHDLLLWVQAGQGEDVLAIETMQATYANVGQSVIDTLVWVGRFRQAWCNPEGVRLISRQQVKAHICNGNVRATDSAVRTALLDRIGPVGTKKSPGPCYGVKSHAWSALAVAVTAASAKGEP